MKKLLYLFTFLLLFVPNVVSAKENINLYLFYSKDCIHCSEEKEFLNDIKDDYPNLNIILYEVKYDKNNYDLLGKVKDAFKCTNDNVPYTVIGTKTFTGYNDNTKDKIIEVIDYYSFNKSRDVVDEVINNAFTGNIKEDDITDKYIYTIPILGKVDIRKVSLPFMAIIIGFIDGFNPCAMWVLLFLISMLFGMKDKKRMWILGLTFLISSALVYMLFMLSWLKVALTLSQIDWIRIIIALVAIIGALVNLNSFYKDIKKKNDGCSVVDNKKRKKIMERIKKFTGEKNFFLALIGIIALAISVNIIELACSAGLPLLYTQILSLSNLSSFHYFIYILLYIFFFLMDDIIIFVIAMISLKLTGISTKYTKYSHLIGGIIMLIIGLLLIFNPSILMFNF